MPKKASLVLGKKKKKKKKNYGKVRIWRSVAHAEWSDPGQRTKDGEGGIRRSVAHTECSDPG